MVQHRQRDAQGQDVVELSNRLEPLDNSSLQLSRRLWLRIGLELAQRARITRHPRLLVIVLEHDQGRTVSRIWRSNWLRSRMGGGGRTIKQRHGRRRLNRRSLTPVALHWNRAPVPRVMAVIVCRTLGGGEQRFRPGYVGSTQQRRGQYGTRTRTLLPMRRLREP